MPGYLATEPQYRKALAAVKALEARIQAGVATPEDRRRYRDGCEHIVLYEMCEAGGEERRQAERERERSRIAQDARRTLPPIQTTPDGPKPILAPARPPVRASLRSTETPLVARAQSQC